jgi:uncharacterized protein (TIGR03435 family)
MRITAVSVVAIAVLLADYVTVEAQGDRPVFEVASVKPNKSGTNLVTATSNATQVIFENVPLDVIISQSFRMRDSFIFGMPGWARQERFDILARTSKPASVAEQGQMLQNLLADRFGLVAHKEQRHVSMYELSIASSDAKLGSQLRRSSVDCAVKPSPCRGRFQQLPNNAGVDMSFVGREWPALVRAIGAELDGPLGDRTGLSGRFDMDLKFARSPQQNDTSAGGYPALFTAVREQLGLRIERTTGPQDVLVIDALSRPTAN